MKLSIAFASLLLGGFIFVGCSKEKTTGTDNNNPPTGSTKKVTVDVTYHNGPIENTASWATWPVAKFATDDNAVKYKVKFYGWNGTYTNMPDSIVYTWKKGELPPAEYCVYCDEKDIKDGYYYVAYSRTWCSGCSAVNAQWEINLKKGYGTPKADITYYY